MNRIITTALAASILAIPAMAEDAPGYFKVPGTETTMKIYGRAQTWAFLDMQRFGTRTFGGDTYIADSSNFEKNVTRSVVKSRIGVTTTTPSSYGDVTMKVEWEAKSESDANSGSLNLRHAYGEFAGLLIGQTDSLFSTWHNCPGYNDTWNADHTGTSRARQIRYTFTPVKEIKVAFSMEQDRSNNSVFKSTKVANMLVGAFQFSGDWGNVVATVGYQRARLWATTYGAGHQTATESGSGLSYAVSAGWNITANDVLVGRVIYGGHQYGNDYNGDGLDVDINGNIGQYSSLSMDLGYAHTWNDQFTSNVGVAQIEGPKSNKYGRIKWTTQEFFVNTNWNVTKTVTFGAEYFYSQTKSKLKDTVIKVNNDTTNKFKYSGFNLMFQYNFF